MRAPTRERMISIMALLLVISNCFLVPKAAAQSDNIRKWRLLTTRQLARRTPIPSLVISRACCARHSLLVQRRHFYVVMLQELSGGVIDRSHRRLIACLRLGQCELSVSQLCLRVQDKENRAST